MRSIITAAAITLVLAGSLDAQTVVVNDNIELIVDIHGATLNVQQDAAATDQTGVVFAYDGSTITPAAITIDVASDWYVVQPGDNFSRATIHAGDFTPLFTYSAHFHPPAYVGSGDFYLGVNTGIGPDFPENRTAFGWVHLRPVNGTLTMVENAIAYDSRGIRVGTTTLVPEPQALVLTGFAMVLLLGFSFRARP